MMARTNRASNKRRCTHQVLTTIFLLVAFQVVASRASLAAGGKPLLLLADADTAGTDALEEILAATGYDVTRVTPEYTWNATNPPLDGFDCVVHLNGATWHRSLPVEAQTALVDFVRIGGGYIGSQWNGLEAAAGWQVDMEDLVLQLYPQPDNGTERDMTWSQVPGQEGHPVLEGVPATFTFFADGHDANGAVVFEEDPSTVLMTSTHGGSAVIVRELENGRVVHFAVAANNSTERTLLDFNILTLYTNAANWVCGEDLSTQQTPVPQCNVPETITPPEAPIVLTATADDSTAVVNVTGFDCFKLKKGKRYDKTGSCIVSYAADRVIIDDVGGVGTHITWTLVATNTRGEMSEELTCEVEVVNPGKGKSKGKSKSKSRGKKKHKKKK